MSRVLLTGFEPFDGARVNPSQEIVRHLDGWSSPAHRVIGLCLPCAFGEARVRLQQAIDEHEPDVVIALGQAANRPVISLERVALNFIDAPIPDNAGRQPMDCPVVAGSPAAYFSTLPLRMILTRIRAVGLPAEISQTAGSYVCNELFYGLMHQLAIQPGRVRAAGFIHVPALPGQFDDNRRGMSLASQIEAIRIAVLTTLSHAGQDLMSSRSEGRVS